MVHRAMHGYPTLVGPRCSRVGDCTPALWDPIVSEARGCQSTSDMRSVNQFTGLMLQMPPPVFRLPGSAPQLVWDPDWESAGRTTHAAKHLQYFASGGVHPIRCGTPLWETKLATEMQ